MLRRIPPRNIGKETQRAGTHLTKIVGKPHHDGVFLSAIKIINDDRQIIGRITIGLLNIAAVIGATHCHTKFIRADHKLKAGRDKVRRKIANEFVANTSLLRIRHIGPQTGGISQLKARFSLGKGGIKEVGGALMQNAIHRLIGDPIARSKKSEPFIRSLCTGRFGHRDKFITVFVFDLVDVAGHVSKTVAGLVPYTHRFKGVRDHAQVVLPEVGKIQRLAPDPNTMIPAQTQRGVGFTDHGKALGTGLEKLRAVFARRAIHFLRGGECCPQLNAVLPPP